MRLPIDTGAVRFVSAEPPEQALDYDTKQPLADAEGNLVFRVHLFAVGAGARDSITVKVAGEPKGLGEFTPVKVTDLVASTWTMGERTGVSFKAAKVEATVPRTTGSGSAS
jgi:hypothetical protein